MTCLMRASPNSACNQTRLSKERLDRARKREVCRMAIEITDADFKHAVELLDAGEVDKLRAWLERHPRLLSETVPLADASAGSYFATPKLLWFVAENPFRNETLPANITAVVDAIVARHKASNAGDIKEDLDTTLALVASGRVARETGQQRPLIETLTRHGANPNEAVVAALAHRETDAADCLAQCGAEMTLSLASGLGHVTDVEQLAGNASSAARQEALTLAAVNGEADAVAILIRHGADPARFNPDHVHAHTTPLHQAIDVGSLATVQALVAGGASIATQDKSVNADALGWARHFGRDDIAAWLEAAVGNID